jgi:hypothetical protein
VSFALISAKKEQLRGFEPWSTQREGRDLPLSYNMIFVLLLYVVPFINILMEHHPHLNLQNKKNVRPWDLNLDLLSGKRETYH